MKIAFTTGEGNWRDIQPLQPDNFKVNPNYDTIEKSFRVHGFRRAFDVWEDDNGVIWSIDGVQRKHVLETRFEDVPDILPFNFHVAKDIEEAKIILVNVFNQRESKVNEQVYDDWIPESEDLIGEVDFEIIENITHNETDYSARNKEIDTDDFADEMVLKLHYTSEDYDIVKSRLLEEEVTAENALYKYLMNES